MNERRFKHTPDEARKLWVEALRSGEFKQGKQYLCSVTRRGERFCCLGVLCEMFIRHEGDLNVVDCDTGEREYAGRETYVPAIVKEWSGLETTCGDFCTDALVNMNDRGKRFSTIAKVIESAPPGLFVEPQATEAR
jgi:hypothetical protein